MRQDAQAAAPVAFESLGEAGDYTTEELRAIIAAEFVANGVPDPSVAKKWPLRNVIVAVLLAGIVLWSLIGWVAGRFF